MGWNILIDEIILDVKTAKKMDPAAKSYAEILFLYQGGHALITYRIAHWLYIWMHLPLSVFFIIKIYASVLPVVVRTLAYIFIIKIYASVLPVVVRLFLCLQNHIL